MNVMIADDSAPIRERVRRLLSQIPQAHVIGEAENEKAMIDLFRNDVPHFAITDLQMLDNECIETIRSARTRFPLMKLLVLTNYYNSKVQNRSYEAGADYVFDKVTEFEDMVSIARLLVETAE